MADWRDKLVAALIEIGSNEGMVAYDQAAVKALIERIAEQEREKSKSERIGCSYAVDNYTERSMGTLLGKVKRAWISSADTSELKASPGTSSEHQPQQPTPSKEAPPKKASPTKAPPTKAPPTKAPPPESTGLTHTICLALKLFKPISPEELVAQCNRTLHENNIDAEILEATPVHGPWVDVLLSYRVQLVHVYDCLWRLQIVQDVVCKPAEDYSKRTTATA